MPTEPKDLDEMVNAAAEKIEANHNTALLSWFREGQRLHETGAFDRPGKNNLNWRWLGIGIGNHAHELIAELEGGESDGT